MLFLRFLLKTLVWPERKAQDTVLSDDHNKSIDLINRYFNFLNKNAAIFLWAKIKYTYFAKTFHLRLNDMSDITAVNSVDSLLLVLDSVTAFYLPI